MAESKVLQINVTCGGTTYPAGTKASDLPKEARDEIADGIGDVAYTAPGEVETSVGAGAYDGREWTKAKLRAEVDKRNEGVPEDQQIVVPEPGEKSELVGALEEYDHNHPA